MPKYSSLWWLAMNHTSSLFGRAVRNVVRLDYSCKFLLFYKNLKNVSCEYDRLNGWNTTLQAAWYIRNVRWTCLFYISFIIWCWFSTTHVFVRGRRTETWSAATKSLLFIDQQTLWNNNVARFASVWIVENHWEDAVTAQYEYEFPCSWKKTHADS